MQGEEQGSGRSSKTPGQQIQELHTLHACPNASWEILVRSSTHCGQSNNPAPGDPHRPEPPGRHCHLRTHSFQSPMGSLQTRPQPVSHHAVPALIQGISDLSDSCHSLFCSLQAKLLPQAGPGVGDQLDIHISTEIENPFGKQQLRKK